MVIDWVKSPCWSATVAPSWWSGVSKKSTIGSPGWNWLPVTVSWLPAGPAAALRSTTPCGRGTIGVGVGLRVGTMGVGTGVG